MENAPPREPLGRPIRLAVLISGGGTTLDNFVQTIRHQQLRAEICIVIASKTDCGGIEKARRHGLKVQVCPRKQFSDVETFSDSIFEHSRQEEADLVVLSGFLNLIQIPDDFLNRVMNIHPSLIPSYCGKGFYGNRVHEAVYRRGVKWTGCTVHFADNEFDHGPIILQKVVSVDYTDSPSQIAQNVFEQECIAYPEAIELYAQGRLRVQERRVQILTSQDSEKS